MIRINLDKVEFTAEQGRWTAFAAALSQVFGLNVGKFEAMETFFDLKIEGTLNLIDLDSLMHAVITHKGREYRLRQITPTQFGGNAYNLATFLAVT